MSEVLVARPWHNLQQPVGSRILPVAHSQYELAVRQAGRLTCRIGRDVGREYGFTVISRIGMAPCQVDGGVNLLRLTEVRIVAGSKGRICMAIVARGDLIDQIASQANQYGVPVPDVQRDRSQSKPDDAPQVV